LTDVYRDTDHRYLHDPAFHAAVTSLEVAATEHGFTPGELKQIAFKAALNLEMRKLPSMIVLSELRPGERPRPHDVAGYLKDGTPVYCAPPQAELVDYHYDIAKAQDAGELEHPQRVIRKHAPHACGFQPESLGDCWFFFSPRLFDPPGFIKERKRP